MSLPIGWENRSNCMSEKDMKLGGIAATKFVDKSLAAGVHGDPSSSGSPDRSRGVYSGGNAGVYQTSDQVREHYLHQIEQQQRQQQANSGSVGPISRADRHAAGLGGCHTENSTTRTASSSTPDFWEDRQRMRALEAEGYRTKGGNIGKQIQQQQLDSPEPSAASNKVVENKKQRGKTENISTKNNAENNNKNNANMALVRVATYTLEQLAETLEQEQLHSSDGSNNAAAIPMEERAAFARAIQRAMQALAASKI